MSIRAKLLLLIALAIGSATCIVTLASIQREAMRFSSAKQAEIEAIAQVFASAAAEAVASNNRGEAFRVLRAMARIPGISYSGIEQTNGRILAELGLNVQLVRDPPDAGLFASLHLLWQDSMAVRVPIIASGEAIGQLILLADTSGLWARALDMTRDALVAGLAAMSAGFMIVFFLQRSIVTRINTMIASMATIQQKHDYSLRVSPGAKDELARVATGFNAMLDEIQLRDEKLARHRASLESEVEERTRDYRIARDHAAAANAAKSEFLATMSHEIRTPMNGILVMAELLAASDLQAKQKRFADVIARSGGSLLAIINDILDFSKIEAGKIELETLPVVVDDIIETVAQLFDEKARSKGLDLSSHIAPNVPARIGADPTRLNQVLSNLVNNALKFTESGSVNLTVTRHPQNAGMIRFSVTDTGIGIAKDKLDHVFDAFSQADQTTTRRFGGTGLGLAICRRLVEAMAGQIEIESELGVGTSFHVYIPIVHVDRMDADRASRHIGEGPVLLAVSGAATRENLSRYLTDFGFDVRDALVDALAGNAAERRLVIADAALLHDPSTARLLRRAKTIVVGNFGDAESDRLIANGTAQAQIIKPISRRELHQVISDVLAGINPAQRAAATIAKETELPKFPKHFILVADDNPVNREVIIESLRRFELPCDTVIHGRAALQAVQSKTYDLVFMDGSMPEMDGFESATRIRTWERETNRPRVPIVALTAHVVGSHADAWKTSGMDAVLHKPFTLQAMAKVLEAHLAPRGADHEPRALIAQASAEQVSGPPASVPLPEQVVPQARPEKDGSALLDPATTQQLLGMAQMGSADAVARIYRLYLDNGPPALAEIEASIALADGARLAKAAHALKSMSLSLGASRVASCAGALEKAGRQGNITQYQPLASEITAELARTYDAIAALQSEHGLLALEAA